MLQFHLYTEAPIGTSIFFATGGASCSHLITGARAAIMACSTRAWWIWPETIRQREKASSQCKSLLFSFCYILAMFILITYG